MIFNKLHRSYVSSGQLALVEGAVRCESISTACKLAW